MCIFVIPHLDHEILRLRNLPYILFTSQSLAWCSLTCDAQLSVLLTALTVTIQKHSLCEFSCNSQSSCFTPPPPSLGQEVIQFYLEAAGHTMERPTWYKTTAVQFVHKESISL